MLTKVYDFLRVRSRIILEKTGKILGKGTVEVTAGNGAGGNANGGSVLLKAGTAAGSGKDGCVISRGTRLRKQVAQTAKTTSATLTAAELLTGIITGNQGAAGAATYTLPLAADVDTALPDSIADDSFDFSVINISTNAAEDITVATNTGWTLVGTMVVESNEATAQKGPSGRFRARKTAAGAWTLYRLA